MTPLELLILYVFWGIIFGLFCAYVAGTKNRSRSSWFLLGFFFNILALLAIRLSAKAQRDPQYTKVESVDTIAGAILPATSLPGLATPWPHFDVSPMSGPLALVCHVPVCTTGGSTERCGQCSQLACAAHRTLRNGTYICTTCDAAKAARQRAVAEQAAQAIREQAIREASAYARSRHSWLFWGNVVTLAFGIFAIVAVVATWASRVPQVRAELAAATTAQLAVFFVEMGVILVLAIGAGLNLWTSGGFRRGNLAAAGGLRYFSYWISAIPGLIIACVSVVGLVILIALAFGAATAAQQEAKIAPIRQGVREGVRDALGDD